jgi:hypothetical protein
LHKYSASSSLQDKIALPSRGASASLSESPQAQESPLDLDKSVPGLSYIAAQTSMLNSGNDSGRYLTSYTFVWANPQIIFRKADRKLYTFTFWSKPIYPFRPSTKIDVDLIQTHLTSVSFYSAQGPESYSFCPLHSGCRFHTIGDKSVAILGFNIFAHEKQRPRYLTVHGMLRDSSIEFLVSVPSAFHIRDDS